MTARASVMGFLTCVTPAWRHASTPRSGFAARKRAGRVYEIVQVMSSQPPGKSMIDPFDAHEVQDFNIWFVLMALLLNAVDAMEDSAVRELTIAVKPLPDERQRMLQEIIFRVFLQKCFQLFNSFHFFCVKMGAFQIFAFCPYPLKGKSIAEKG